MKDGLGITEKLDAFTIELYDECYVLLFTRGRKWNSTSQSYFMTDYVFIVKQNNIDYSFENSICIVNGTDGIISDFKDLIIQNSNKILNDYFDDKVTYILKINQKYNTLELVKYDGLYFTEQKDVPYDLNKMDQSWNYSFVSC